MIWPLRIGRDFFGVDNQLGAVIGRFIRSGFLCIQPRCFIDLYLPEDCFSFQLIDDYWYWFWCWR